MVKDFRIPVRIVENQFGHLECYQVAPAIAGEPRAYLQSENEMSLVWENLSRHQAYRLRRSGDAVVRLHDEVVCGIFGIDY